MDCWGGDGKGDDNVGVEVERRACSELAWAGGIFAVAYLVTLLVWRACA